MLRRAGDARGVGRAAAAHEPGRDHRSDSREPLGHRLWERIPRLLPPIGHFQHRSAFASGRPAPGQRKSCWYAPKLVDNRRGNSGGYGGADDRSGYRGRDRDYDRPMRRSEEYDAPRRRYRGEPDTDE